MSDLLQYNNAFVPPAFGITNIGNSCFFNSLMQSLLCCSSVWQVLEIRKFIANKSDFEILITDFYKKSMNNPEELNAEPIYEFIIAHIKQNASVGKKGKSGVEITNRAQADVHELFNYICKLFGIYIPEILKLFMSSTTIITQCRFSNISLHENVAPYFNVSFNIDNAILRGPLRSCDCISPHYIIASSCLHTTPTKIVDKYQNNKFKQNLYEKDKTKKITIHDIMPLDIDNVLENTSTASAECICKDEALLYMLIEPIETTTQQTLYITMIPEILCFVFEKSGGKYKVICPHTLYIPASKTTKRVYRHVAHCNHKGNASSGHYWAHGLRRDSKWYELNDKEFCETKDADHIPSEDTYLIFYHYFETIAN